MPKRVSSTPFLNLSGTTRKVVFSLLAMLAAQYSLILVIRSEDLSTEKLTPRQKLSQMERKTQHFEVLSKTLRSFDFYNDADWSRRMNIKHSKEDWLKFHEKHVEKMFLESNPMVKQYQSKMEILTLNGLELLLLSVKFLSNSSS